MSGIDCSAYAGERRAAERRDEHGGQRDGLGDGVEGREAVEVLACQPRWSAENSANARHTGTTSSRAGRHAAQPNSSANAR